MIKLNHLALACRILAIAAEKWAVLCAAAFLLLPFGPHLSLGETGYRCAYLGSRGIIHIRNYDGCPVLRLIDTTKGRP